MLEAITIIIALGGLEIALWWADHKRQQDQLETLEAIWVELALLNEGTSRIHSRESSSCPPIVPGRCAKRRLPVTDSSDAINAAAHSSSNSATTRRSTVCRP